MNIEQLHESGMIIFSGIVGSQAYGISTPTSDIDKKGVFIQSLDSILGIGYIEQISDEKNDQTFYEVRRFLELLRSNNPNILELLNLPEDCIVYKEPIFDQILEHKEKFITKICKASFGGYAIEQIKKARGMNKKIVNPVAKERKSIMDFCYVVSGYDTVPLKNFLDNSGYRQEKCGLVNLPHARDVYSLFYDHFGTIPYKGIINADATSNEVRLSSIPKGESPVATMIYNKDGYTKYCKDYREYWNWVEKRNPTRYADNMSHGGGYDGKNLAHCHRLLDMSIEILSGQGINVRRPNREQLLSIRRGEYEYDLLILEAETKIKEMERIVKFSSLPDSVDEKFVDDLLIKIRKQRYGL
jgi:hypothetical protein